MSNLKALPVIIGHKLPMFSFWNKFKYLSFQKTDFKNTLYLPPPTDFGNISDRELGEYYFLFGLKKFLTSEQSDYSILIVAHYRRFLTSSATGNLSNFTDQSFTRSISPGEAEKLSVDCILPKNGSWLIGSPVKIHNGKLLLHFQMSHPLQEYLKFLQIAIELEILTPLEVIELLNETHMIIAPSVGVFPIHFILDTLGALELLVREYLRTQSKTYSGYNQRIIAFCLERIHSFLLMREVIKLGIIGKVGGFQVVITEDGIIRPSGI